MGRDGTARNAASSSRTAPAPGWRRAWSHRLAHFWPRCAAVYVRDLVIRLPQRPGDGRIAALTFDDGPTDAGTPRLLEVLARYGVRATFFLLGENVRRHPHRAREIVAAGHQLGNHFRRHIDCWKTSPRTVIREVSEGSRMIEEATGIRPAWCRPPYGRLTHAVVKWSRIHRQPIVLWDVFPPDALETSRPAELSRVLEQRLRPRSIVCLHDNEASRCHTPLMLEASLPRLLSAGWTFVGVGNPPSECEAACERPARRAG